MTKVADNHADDGGAHPTTLRLSCASRDIFSVLMPFERRGFEILRLTAKCGEATIELRVDNDAGARAIAMMVPAIQESLPYYAHLISEVTTSPSSRLQILLPGPALGTAYCSTSQTH